MRYAIALHLLLAACSTPTPQIRIGWTDGPVQQCPSTNCKDIPLPCDPVLCIRILDPVDPNDRSPSAPYLSQCTKVSNKTGNACAFNSIDLDPTPLPVHKLEVQIAAYSASALGVNGSGDLVAPDIQFGEGTGFPLEAAPAPVFGGRAYYHPGDEFVDVTLGCTDLGFLTAPRTCDQPSSDATTVRVEDFDTQLSVTGGQGGIASDLFVSIGEPHLLDGRYVLQPADTLPLQLQGGDQPTWTASVTRSFSRSACVEVLEDVPDTAATVRCVRADDPLPALTGTRLARDRLQEIVDSLSLSNALDDGLTVGIVVDKSLAPAAGYVVTAGDGSTVSYVSETNTLGFTATFKTGIFVSRNAAFGTQFFASGPSSTIPALGGRIAGKVTIAVIQVAP